MDIILITNLLLVVVLIGLTAFFVGSEFAVVKVRMSRLDQLIAEGNKKADKAKKVAEKLDYYLSACQLGITVTALGLGWLGKPTVERLLYPLFDSLGTAQALATIISFVIAFSVVTFLHVVIGELAPKTLAIQYAEKMTLLLAPPLYWFGKLMFPFIWTLNGSARLFLRMFGVEPAGHEQAHSEEELKIIMTQSFQSGEINKTELQYMENIFAFDERAARDIMIPRTDMNTLRIDMNQEEMLEVFHEHEHTRYPVTEDGDKDNVIGFVNVKKILIDYVAGRRIVLRDYMQSLPVMPEHAAIQDVLVHMKKERVHMALLLDEYGGTAGLVTMEDILEEIVGEIRDEFDTEEVSDIQKVEEGLYHINGRTLLDDIEKQLSITFSNEEEIDTIGGWLQMNNVPLEPNKVVEQDGKRWEILDTDHHQIKQVSLQFINTQQII
ncbi:CBS domain containing-hemolysin-like protein [Sinobaca qinghaiensis]|uniref:CBS domain containing-hemolysin-like protein n=1 Tax=Sinobaca qinghaiensis TaxID=342944 RepID=A0A419UX35_9BACL|nr:hemolysin family protein [Sinobaca qinghaiensis]RKD69705.1 CBS domain containing-hemolysin-like protein [Sinobaca qinghaiensis]